MSRKPAERSNPCFTFLRRLRAGGRSNMYGAIPYLVDAFGCNRDEAFRIVCEWLDAQSAAEAAAGPKDAASVPSVGKADEVAREPRAVRRKLKRGVQRNQRKPSRHKAA